MVPGFKHKGRRLRFPSRPSHFRKFDPVIDRISQDVGQGCFERRENLAIDSGATALNLETNLLAQFLREITDHPWKSMAAIFERPHSTSQHLTVQIRGDFLGPPEQSIEIVDQTSDRETAFVDLSAQFAKRIAVIAQRRPDSTFHSFQSLIELGRLLSNPLESARGDHDLARKLHHSFEPTRINSNGAGFLALGR